MVPNPIRLVCFDLGRVLIRICNDWDEACGLAGTPPPARAKDAPVVAQMEQIAKRHETGSIDAATFAQEVSAVCGLRPDQVMAISNVWLRGAYPGVAELIDEVAAADVSTACLSNTNDNHWRLMNGPGGPNALPLHRLDHRFASHLIGRAKPHPATYDHVERETDTPGGSVLFFDDNAANIAASRDRGWQAHVIADNGDPVSQVRRHLQDYRVL